MPTSRQRVLTPFPSILHGVGFAAALGVLAGSLMGTPDVFVLLGPAAVGAVVSIAVWARSTRRHARRRSTWPRMLGSGIGLWSLGQLIVASEWQRGERTLLSVGEIVALLALAFGTIAVATVVRRSAYTSPGVRLGVDALMLGATGCLLVWRWQFEGHPSSGAVAATLLPGFVMGSLAVLLRVRRPNPEEQVFIAGLAALALGSVSASLALFDGLDPSPLAAILYCLALPAIARPAWVEIAGDRVADIDANADNRQAATAISATLVLAAVFVVVQFIDRHPSTTAGSLLIATATGAFFVRQALDHRQRSVIFRQLKEQLRTDAMTSLGNRLAIEQLDPGSSPFDLAVVGIDGLGRLSELHGHAAGDALLLAVADALDAVVPDRHAIARIDGHEFAVAFGPVTDLADVAETVQAAVEAAALRDQFAFGQRMAISTGAARSTERDRDGLGVLARAQRARHVARQRDARTLVFDDDLARDEQRLRLLDQRLPGALDEGRIGVHLQPIVDMGTRRVVGVEALARWTDPELGPVRPDEFIPRAEANGEVVRLGLSVLRAAVSAADMLGFAHSGRHMTVNVSVGQLRGIDDGGRRFSDHVLQVLAEADVPSSVLVCEITESMVIVENDPAVAEMRRLAEIGVRIAIDDFGSGHWALGYLRWLPADIIKLDRDLVATIDTNPRAGHVVASIVGLSARLGADLVAEGIEDESVAQAAATLGVRLAQGWHYARAVPVDEIVALIESIERPASDTGSRDGPRASDRAGRS